MTLRARVSALAFLSLALASGCGGGGGGGTTPPTPAALSAGAAAFGTRAVGATAELPVTISNSGGSAATSLAAAAPEAPFGFKGGSYPGAGGTCGATLAEGASCTVVLTFAPVSAGAATPATVAVAYQSGAGAAHVDLALSGAGAAPAHLAWLDGAAGVSSYAFGQYLLGGAALEHTLTLSNDGGVPATGLSATAPAAPFGFKGGSYPGTAGTCGSALAASASCTVVVTFAATSAGTPSGSLSVAYSDGVAAQGAALPLSGTAKRAAALAVSDPGYAFGTVAVGGAKDYAFTVSNGGDVDATAIAPPALSAPWSWKGGGAFPGATGTCGTTLAPAATCTFAVTFSPVTAAVANATLSLGYQDGNGSATAPGSASGTGAAAASIADASASFGTVAIGATGERAVTLTNSGGVAATSLAVSVAPPAPYGWKGGAYPGTGGTCGASLAAGAFCTLVVTFAPSAASALPANLRLSYQSGAGSSTVTTSLSGTGANKAVLAWDAGASFSYGLHVTGSSTDQPFTITNTGGVPATGLAAGAAVPSAFDWKGSSFPGAGGTCGATLAAGSTCTVVVTYLPAGGQSGTLAGNLSIGYGDGVISTQSAGIALSGVAAAPALLSLTPAGATYDFGTVAQNASVDETFTVMNGGGVAATSIQAVAPSSPFSFKGGSYPGTTGTCGSQLSSLSSCTVVVTFHPTSSGAATGSSFSLQYSDGATSHSTGKSLAGAATALAHLAFSEASWDYGTLAVNGTGTHTFTLQNTGGSPATGLGLGAGLASQFTVVAGGTCAPGGTIAAGASCTIALQFKPDAASPFSSALAASYSGGDAASASAALSGTGTNGPALAFTELGFDWSVHAIGSTSDHTFTVSNTGGQAAPTVAAAALPPGFTFKGHVPYPGMGGTCASSIAAGASCAIVVSFEPAQAQAYAGALQLTSGGNPAASATLSGAGAQPAALTVSVAMPVVFPSAVVGSSSEASVTVQNEGGVPATGMGAVASPAAFMFKGTGYPGTGGTCSPALAPGDSCTLVLVFQPAGAAPASGSVTLGYQTGVSGTSLGIPLSGTGTAPALLAFSDGATYPFPATLIGRTATHQAMVINSGGVGATGMGSAALLAPYSYSGGSYPGQNGTCGATLAASTSCTVEIVYTPAQKAAVARTATLDYQDGVLTQHANLGLSGTGLDPAQLSFSGASAYADTVVGNTTAGTVTVQNDGQASATALGATLPPGFAWTAGGSYPGGGTCASTLAAGASCTLGVSFQPGAPGATSGVVTVSFNDGVQAQSAQWTVSGKALGPAHLLYADGASFDFGTVAVGQVVTHIVTVANDGDVAATVLSPSIASPFAWSGGAWPGFGGTCGAQLAGGTSCRAIIQFAPVSGTPASGTLGIGYKTGVAGAPDPVVGLQLSGTGTSVAHLAITDWPPLYYTGYGLPPDGPTFDFGSVGTGTTADHTFYVTNTGAGTATFQASGVPSPFAFLGGSFPGAGGSCAPGGTLAAGATCTIVVGYSPSSATASTQDLSVGYGDGAGGNLAATRTLTGTGTAAAALVVYDFAPAIRLGPWWDFGSIGVGLSSDKDFTVVNEGKVAAVNLAGAPLPAGFSWKDGAFPGSGGTCVAGGSLAAGASCTVYVTFAPQSAGPSAHAEVAVQYGDGTGTGRTAIREARGTGITTALLLVEQDAGAYIDFGTVGVGQSLTLSLRVQNVGGAAAAAIAVSGLSVPFSIDPSYPTSDPACGATLAMGTTCSLAVKFAPAAAGTFQQQVTVSYSDLPAGGQPQSAARALTGKGTDRALVVIADWSGGGQDANPDPNPFDFGTWGQPVTHDFWASNVGAQDATAVGPLAPSGPFSYASTTCGATLAAGATCRITVAFTPSGDGSAAATIGLQYADGGGGAPVSATRDVTGTSTSGPYLVVTQCNDSNCGDDGRNPVDFGTSGFPVDKSLYLQNRGGADATALAAVVSGGAFGFDSGSYPGVGVNPSYDAPACGASLARGAACTIGLRFTPSGAGARAGSIAVSWYDGANTASTLRGLSGTAVDHALLLVEDWPNQIPWQGMSPYDYGTAGQPVNHEFTLANAGPAVATYGVASLPAGFGFRGPGGVPGSFPGTGGTCSGGSLGPNASCTVEISFYPAQIGNGPAGGTFSLAYGDGKGGTGSATRALQAVATNRANLYVSDWYDTGSGQTSPPNPGSTFDFGTVGQASSHTFYVVNAGMKDAVVTPAALGNGFAWNGGSFPGSASSYPGEPAACPVLDGGGHFAVAKGTACGITVVFDPSAAPVGPHAAQIALAYSDSIGPVGTATRDLTATKTDQPILVVLDGPWGGGGGGNQPPNDFGIAGQAVTRFLVVKNIGGGAANGVGGGLGPDPWWQFAGGAFPGTGDPSTNGYPPLCGASIAVAESCSVAVTFRPELYAPPQGAPPPPWSLSATLDVSYLDGNSQTLHATRALQGEATNQAMLTILDWPGNGPGGSGYTPPPFDYGTQGQTVSHAFIVTNSGGAAATFANPSVSGGEFRFAGGTPFPGSGSAPPSYPPFPGDCGATLAVGTSCTFYVEFVPAAPFGTLAAGSIDLGYTDSNGGSATAHRAVQGTPTDRAFLLVNGWMGSMCDQNGCWWDFGPSQVGQPHAGQFWVNNNGKLAATSLGAGTGWAAPFAFEALPVTQPPDGNECWAGTILPPGSGCWFAVDFTPPAEQTYTATGSLAFSDSLAGTRGPPAQATWSMQGTGY